MVARHGTAPPVRGTRPANRRQLITQAAADLFCRNGYAGVAVGDIADAVAIGPSALYRHFHGKQELLATVVDEGLATVEAAIEAVSNDPSRDLAAALAAAALAQRRVGVLWQRESRHLTDAHRAQFRAAVKRIGARCAELIRTRRPALSANDADLLARSGLAVATSVSFHTVELPELEFRSLLTNLVSTVFDAEITSLGPDPDRTLTPGNLTTRSRRETILTEATKLFAANGFANVGVDDIGAGVGIAGSSIYKHFNAKSDILAAALQRGDDWLRTDLHRILVRARTPRDGVRRLVDSYSNFVFDEPQMIQLLVSESVHLPAPDRHHARTSQHTYIAEWIHLVRQVHPDRPFDATRVRVQATQSMLNHIALTPHLRSTPTARRTLADIGTALLTQ
ncbi:TetR/AcrR family transcriptional regulator [Nocardia sp. NBC_00511]|uniref:TetR/AcrR family transcriptional regulator n=1 Tax=Nocardia sp. NBC_00511 TaxID=2903591 RepID=UPI0030E14829